MNQVMMKAKKSIHNQKKKYLFLSVIMIIGFISGILFIYFITKEDKSLVKNELETFFLCIKNNDFKYWHSFVNGLISNSLYFFIVWILGISIIGIPIIIFMLFLKCFTLGFSVSSIINHYGLKGIFLALSELFPHSIILVVLLLLLSFYAINFSVHLFHSLFLKKM